MEIEEENLDEIFSKHKKINCDIIKCKFDKDNIEKNKILLEEYEKEGLINRNNFYSLDKNELEDPIEMNLNKIKKDVFFNNLINDNIKNSYLYCGYLDNIDSLSLENKKLNSKIQISCPFCFNVLSKNFINDDKSYEISKKTKNFYKDFFETYNAKEIIEIIKVNYNKNSKMPNFNINNANNKILKKEILEIEEYLKEIYEDNAKNLVSLKCINCNNHIGFFNNINENYIIYNFI